MARNRRRKKAPPASAGARLQKAALINWSATHANVKRRFDDYDYDAYNRRQVEELKRDRYTQIKHRKAMLRALTHEIMRQTIDNHPDKGRAERPIWFPLETKLSSLGTLIDRHERSIRRYLHDLVGMGILLERETQSRGIHLALDPALFVFHDDVQPSREEAQRLAEAVTQAPVEGPISAERLEQIRAAGRQKNAKNGLHPLPRPSPDNLSAFSS